MSDIQGAIHGNWLPMVDFDHDPIGEVSADGTPWGSW